MARKDTPPARAPHQERELTGHQAAVGAAAIVRQIGAAFTQRAIREDDSARVIFLGTTSDGANRQAIYPTYEHRWSNNRQVATMVVRTCVSRGYKARVIEPERLSGLRSEIGFEVLVPRGMQLRMI